MKNWSEVLLNTKHSLKESIDILHSGGLRIALVVDSDNKLLGTVTDGDIRRALIKHTDMDFPITKVMNANPVTAQELQSRSSIMSLMKDLNLIHVPIIDKNGTLVALETLHHLLRDVKYDNPVFLMAGGFGTRLWPLTEKKPKPLLNVGNQPILETIIKQFSDAGFHNFYISTHYKAEMIYEYFGDGSKWNVKIEYLYEESPLGTAGSLGLLPDNIPELPIIMMNGDLLTKVNFENLLNFHHEQGGIATMCIKEYDFQVPYGAVDIKNQCLTSIKEKPVHKFFVNAGIYILEPKLVKQIGGDSYLDVPNLFEAKIEQGERIGVFPIHEYWLDIGRIEEYEQANKEVIDIL
jgi:dTDP-glucose pyrophosphorylase